MRQGQPSVDSSCLYVNAENQPSPPCSPDFRQSNCSTNSLHSRSEAGFDSCFGPAKQLLQAGRRQEAAAEFANAAQRWSQQAAELSNTDPAQAIKHLEAMLALEAPPTIHAGAWWNIGCIHKAQGRTDEAEECFRKSKSICKPAEKPQHAPSGGSGSEPPKTPFSEHYAAAVSFLEKGDVEKSAKKFLQAAIADPEKFCSAAIEIGRIGQPMIAMGALSELLRICKTDQLKAAAWCAIGNVYTNEGKREEAMECFVKSWDLFAHPGSAANRALIHLWNGEVDDAERWINRSLDMVHWLPSSQFVQSMISSVGRGKYLTGFKQYEARWRGEVSGSGALRKLPSDKPEWPGPSECNGRLLVYGEQGMGDTILALRYAKEIKKLGLKQIWVVQSPLRTLTESLGIIDEVRSPGEEFNEYDFHIPAMSLPRVFQTTVENVPPTPYINRHPIQFVGPKLHVGICWGGSSINRNNHIRSAPLSNWNPVFDIPDVEFHSFQVDGSEEALAYPAIRIGPKPKDWLDTAHRVSAMDLVISVDTALVHLCGAMGIPCWCALHCRPYFVYPLTHEHTPWYSSVKLFKQQREFEWGPVFERIANELAAKIV